MTINTMIVYKKICNSNSVEINACKNLINKCFPENRFDDYEDIIVCYYNGEIIGFVGIYDNLLNQLCVAKEYRYKGIATKMMKVSKKVLPSPFYLYVDKNKEKTKYLLNFYLSRGFRIDSQNDVEYKMVFDNRFKIKNTFLSVLYYFKNIFRKLR